MDRLVLDHLPDPVTEGRAVKPRFLRRSLDQPGEAAAKSSRQPAEPRRRREPLRRHPLAPLLVLFIALSATGGLYTLLSPGRQAAAASAQSLAIEEGRKLYVSGCSSCHGLNAEGSSDGPTLVGVGAAAVDFQVSTGRMPATRQGVQEPKKKPVYTQAEVDQLAAYIASLAPGPAVPAASDYDTNGANVAEGGELFRTNCAACHNFVGSGGALTGGKYAPKLTGVDSKHIYEAMLTGPQSMPVFNDETITPDQKRDIVAFLNYINTAGDPGGANLGRIGPVSEGLLIWIFGIGSLIGVTVWLTARSS
jgi:quinol---cytochrome-c reductase cytochrome c subunit